MSTIKYFCTMSKSYNTNPSQPVGPIELVNPPEVTIVEGPKLVDFRVISKMMKNHEA